MAVKPRQMPDPPTPQDWTVETVFEVRVRGDLGGPLREVLARSFRRTVAQITGCQVLVVARQILTPPEGA